MRIFLVKLRYRIFIIYLSFRWIFWQNIGTKVIYNNSIHTICNGTRANSWRLDNLPNGDDGWVHRSDCRFLFSVENIIHSFRAGYSFYMHYWFDIWVRNGVEDWCKGCQIWPGGWWSKSTLASLKYHRK